MISEGYRKYLRSKKWAKKRNECFAYYGKRCRACGKTTGPIQVHHMDYSRLGNESMQDIIPLCIKCHREVTKIYRRNRRRGLRRVTMEYIKIKQRSKKK